MGIDKLAALGLTVFGFFFLYFKVSKPFILGSLILLIQYFSAIFYPESFRISTFLYSAALIFSFISVYTLVYDWHIFTNQEFRRLIVGLMTAFFIVCIIQQIFILIGVKVFPWINLIKYLDRSLGCNSLSYEPSSFARFMFVYYYAYIKCVEYDRGYPLSIKELFSSEYYKITSMFLWMMLTMGSGTAFVCLALLSLNFLNRSNWYYIVPVILCIFFVILPMFQFEHANRAANIMTAMTTFDQGQVEAADGSAASRISPLLNSFNADFSKKETWFGYGTDYAVRHQLFIKQTGTLFDDYGFLWYLATLALSLSTAYGYSWITIIYLFAGVAGGANGNINYAWGLMTIMSCVRYFYLNRKILC